MDRSQRYLYFVASDRRSLGSCIHLLVLPLLFSYALFGVIFSKGRSLLSWPFAVGGAIWTGYNFYQYFFGLLLYSQSGLTAHSASVVVTFAFLYVINWRTLRAKVTDISDEVKSFGTTEDSTGK